MTKPQIRLHPIQNFIKNSRTIVENQRNLRQRQRYLNNYQKNITASVETKSLDKPYPTYLGNLSKPSYVTHVPSKASANEQLLY